VENAAFHDVAGQKAASSPAFVFSNVKEVTLQQCKGAKDAVIRAARKREL
jgi:hypothetical protein